MPTYHNNMANIAATLMGGDAPKPIVGRKVVSLNTNNKYAIDKSRPIFLNKKTRKKMRPVLKLDRNGKVKYRTAINLVDAIPATQKAAVRARRAARKRPSTKKTKKTKSKKTKKTKSKKTKSKKTKSKKTKKTKTKKTTKEIITTKRPNPFARFLSLDQNNPAVRTLKNTFNAMENRRLSLTKKK